VAAGLGWSIVPRSFSRIFPDNVVYVRIDDDIPSATIALARRRDDRSTAVKNFVACARQQAREQISAKPVHGVVPERSPVPAASLGPR
jgi:DNA-binding transcriptional LysR family regulator